MWLSPCHLTVIVSIDCQAQVCSRSRSKRVALIITIVQTHGMVITRYVLCFHTQTYFSGDQQFVQHLLVVSLYLALLCAAGMSAYFSTIGG